MTQAMLKVRNLVKRYNGFTAVNDLSFEVYEVVIGTDPSATLRAGPEALEKHGQAFVEEQGSNADYELCEVAVLPSEQAADLVSIQGQGLLSTPQDMQVVPLWCKRCDWRGLSSEAG